LPAEDADTCSEINHPTGDISAIYLQSFRTWSGAQSRLAFGGCGAWEDAVVPAQNLVNDQIAAVVPGAVTMFATVAGDMARAINQARVVSLMTIEPADADGAAAFTHELRQMEVTLHDLAGGEHSFAADLRAAGFRVMPTSGGTATIAGRRVELADHSFTLEWGRLLQHIYTDGLLPILGYGSSAAMLRAWIDCTEVGSTLASSVGLLSETQYTDACNAGLDVAGATIDALGLAAFVDESGTLTLAGTASAAGIGEDGVAQRLESGVWSGDWSEGTASGPVTGTFTGLRR
jgi:hypothetical protein